MQKLFLKKTEGDIENDWLWFSGRKMDQNGL
jgi:hypothetical protein